MAKTCIFRDFSRFFTIFHDFSRFFGDFSRFFLKKRHLVAKTCIFHDFSRFFGDFSRFFLKKRHLVAKKWTKAPSCGENLHLSRFFTIFWRWWWRKIAFFSVFSCLFTFQLFVYFSQFSAVCLLSQFSAVCLLSQFCKQTADFSVFSCLFTFQLFVYFLSFVNKQLFVYISQQNPGFGFFVPSWPQSNASIRSQFLTAVCLHFDSCLFTFSQFFVNKQLTLFTFDSCLFTFSQFFVNKQLTLFTFFSCLFTFSQFL